MSIKRLITLVLVALVAAALLSSFTELSFNASIGIVALAAMAYYLSTLVDDE